MKNHIDDAVFTDISANQRAYYRWEQEGCSINIREVHNDNAGDERVWGWATLIRATKDFGAIEIQQAGYEPSLENAKGVSLRVIQAGLKFINRD